MTDTQRSLIDSGRRTPDAGPRTSSRLDAVRQAIRQMQGYTPGEQPQDKRYIKLNSNENPYPPSPHVIAALQRALGEDLRLYPDPVAQRLRDKAAAVYGLSREQVLVGNGSDDLLTMLMRTFVGQGERVAFPFPTYSLYDVLVAMQEGEVVRVPFPADFSLPAQLAEVEAKLTFLCHPNAPSGTLTPLRQVEELARHVRGILVIDEAYIDFANETALPLLHKYPHVIILRTFSKSFSLAGMRVGLAFAHSSLINEMMKVKDSYNVSRLSLVAAVAALEDYAWMRRNVDKIRTTRTRLSAALRDFGYFVHDSQANFVLARQQGVAQEPVYLGLKERGLLVRYFSSPELADCLRISVGTDEEIDRLLAAMQELRQNV
ncbi:MAG TPA: histidinol-phosphate transaminase [Candidatus Binatia bacterium]|nr:histidinol-phosphate transaminase [Candidatus Binatia bacterium]